MNTRITELLGIEAPIIQGAMARIADASLAGAVSAAGGLGIIACGGAPLEWVEQQVAAVARSPTTPSEPTSCSSTPTPPSLPGCSSI